jgi:purine nucleosidase
MPELNLIIDTDAGVDDALGLLMALQTPDVKVRAITTVSGNVSVDQVTKNVRVILGVAGKNVPVYKGCSGAIFATNIEPVTALMGEDGLGGTSLTWPEAENIQGSEHAALALIRLAREIHEQGEDLVIAAIGPLTNLALALRLEPKFVQWVNRLVVMGGTLAGHGNATPAAEFNFCADPESAAIVLAAGFPRLEVLTWETSIQHALKWSDLEHLVKKSGRGARFIKECCAQLVRVLRDEWHMLASPMPDPLTMLAVLDPQSVIQSTPLAAWVETQGEFGRGMLALDWHNNRRAKPNIILLECLDYNAFIRALERAAL